MLPISDSEAIDPTSICGDWTNHEDLLRLWSQPLRLFQLANRFRQASCGENVSFVINRNINFTNLCVGTCEFCAFRSNRGYFLSEDEILERVASAEQIKATEICLQGGLAPGMVIEDYCEILEIVHRNFPRMHLHAYSPMEIIHMSRNSGTAIEDALIELKRSGLGSIPGTAAEILMDPVRKRICPEKLTTAEWCHIIMTAHTIGLPSTSTMLYGHVENLDDRLKHLQILRRIQAQTHGFTEFVLLPFMPGNNSLGPMASRPDFLDHLKMHALSRVALHPSITNIQVSWTKLGRELAGATLAWGVNDFGGTLMEENISRSAGAKEKQYLSPQEIQEIIEGQGKKAVQRTTLYGIIR
jgi:5-amino-6-(D-ribitylamino)uracil---L-tyrosine 4-hydroxyphenyl transferase